MRKLAKLSMILMLLSVTVFQSCKKDDVKTITNNNTSANYLQLRSDMTKLWAEHMNWTYSTVEAFFHAPDQLNARLNRLLANQEDIGNAIAVYYGTEVGKTVEDSLKAHIMDAVPVLTAAQNGDEAALEKAVNDWFQNAENIGKLLASVNPYWDEEMMVEMMRKHISSTIDYSLDLLHGDYEKSIDDFQIAFDHMMMMADDLSEGIYKQFPEKF
ncbi:MAG: hypothetical protein M9887_05175 [Chitinophagales bacterium]|nr:hypothetical protein [Chitinophagales bacterium]